MTCACACVHVAVCVCMHGMACGITIVHSDECAFIVCTCTCTCFAPCRSSSCAVSSGQSSQAMPRQTFRPSGFRPSALRPSQIRERDFVCCMQQIQYSSSPCRIVEASGSWHFSAVLRSYRAEYLKSSGLLNCGSATKSLPIQNPSAVTHTRHCAAHEDTTWGQTHNPIAGGFTRTSFHFAQSPMDSQAKPTGQGIKHNPQKKTRSKMRDRTSDYILYCVQSLIK
mmetsp:Transcript_633/g.1334  ORF Transcript_633/g.1334 Transcript_633/m.1334 type:complete len:225 (+) Transcript_633:157-831(+)